MFTSSIILLYSSTIDLMLSTILSVSTWALIFTSSVELSYSFTVVVDSLISLLSSTSPFIPLLPILSDVLSPNNSNASPPVNPTVTLLSLALNVISPFPCNHFCESILTNSDNFLPVSPTSVFCSCSSRAFLISSVFLYEISPSFGSGNLSVTSSSLPLTCTLNVNSLPANACTFSVVSTSLYPNSPFIPTESPSIENELLSRINSTTSSDP